MENIPLQNVCSYGTLALAEDPFFFSSQLHPLDFSGFSSFNCQWEIPVPESVLQPPPMLESLSTPCPLYTSSHGESDAFGDLDEVVFDNFESDKQIVLFNKEENGAVVVSNEKNVHESRERKSLRSCSELRRETISSYFYMPITKAAKELNVGLTQLKKRCRELGIRRWPHRKLMSLQALISNVQEAGTVGGEASDANIRDVLNLLEKQKKLMEKMPEVELEDNTKKLRQAYFKLNYKRRKIMGMLEWQPSPVSF